MIKFVGAKPGDGRTVVGLGLSAENLRRLQEDQPIVVELRELGAIGPDTKMHVDLTNEGGR